MRAYSNFFPEEEDTWNTFKLVIPLCKTSLVGTITIKRTKLIILPKWISLGLAAILKWKEILKLSDATYVKATMSSFAWVAVIWQTHHKELSFNRAQPHKTNLQKFKTFFKTVDCV